MPIHKLGSITLRSRGIGFELKRRNLEVFTNSFLPWCLFKLLWVLDRHNFVLLIVFIGYRLAGTLCKNCVFVITYFASFKRKDRKQNQNEFGITMTWNKQNQQPTNCYVIWTPTVAATSYVILNLDTNSGGGEAATATQCVAEADALKLE